MPASASATDDPDSLASQSDVEAARYLCDAYHQLQAELGKVIVGQDRVVEEILIAIFARGHCVMQGVPGLAKTLLVSTLSQAMELSFQRIQFTPDLMPSDITGTDVLQEDPETGRRRFEFMKGPIFGNLLLADEINRTPPKTQAALLQAMQEREVSIGQETYKLPDPFFVIATQNPIEQEGTYPLPEAQLDRFLLEIRVRYPDLDAERAMLLATTGATETMPEQALTPAELMAAQALIRRVPVGESVLEAILKLVRGGRPETAEDADVREYVAWGPGPRASQALMLASRARAVLDGRLVPSVEDVAALAHPVLRHRMALKFSAPSGLTLAGLIDRLVERLG